MDKENFGNVDQTNEKITGVVKHWKGAYGFVTPDNSKLDDVFIHCSQIEPWRKGFKELAVGDKVNFSYREGKKGLEAFNLEIERNSVDDKKFKMNKQ